MNSFFRKTAFIFFLGFFLGGSPLHAEEISVDPEVVRFVQQQIANSQASETSTETPPPEEGDKKPEIPRSDQDFLRSLKDLQGSFDVQLFSGSAAYQYPINIPEGRLGMTPQINLSYSSNNRRYDSLIGYGWDMPIDSIYRNATKGSEKIYSRNDFSAMVNGQGYDLVLVDEETHLYMAEIEGDFSRFFFDPQKNSWEIQDITGNKYFFGSTTESRQDNPEENTEVFRWMIDRKEDIHGNFISYEYFKDAGQIFPEKIRYTGNGNDEGLYEIRFGRSPGNRYSSYARGFKTTNNFLISSIELYEHSTGSAKKVYEYQITHNDSLLPALTFPESIQLVLGNDSLPKTTFEYYTGGESDPGKKRGFLKTITEPLGGKTTLRYKPSTAYRTGSGANSLRNKIPFVIHTLHTRDTQANSFSPVFRTTYEYENGHYYFDNIDAYKKEYAGFGHATVTEDDGKSQEFFFHQSEFSKDYSSIGEFEDHISKKGKIFRTETKDENGNIFQTHFKKWTHVQLSDEDSEKDRFFVSLESEVISDTDGNADNRSTATEYQYDQYGNKILEKNYGEVLLNGQNGSFTDTKNDLVQTETQYAHNPTKYLHRFPKEITAKDASQKFLRKSKYWYDEEDFGIVETGLLTKTEDLVDTSETTITTETTYNSFGLPITKTNPRAFDTNISYDQFDLFPETITNAKGHQTTTQYDYRFGNPRLVIDPNGAETETIFDSFGRAIETKVSDPDFPTNRITQSKTIYDMTTLPRKISQEFFPNIPNTTKKTTQYIDGFGNPINAFEWINQSNGETYIFSGKIYDHQQRIKKELLPVFTQNNTFIEPNSSNLGAEYTYDSLGRIKRLTSPLGTTSYEYDQWKTTITDPEENQKAFHTDARKNLIQVDEKLNGNWYETQYEYNLNNNLINITDALGNERNMTYDLLGRILSKEKLHAPSATNVLSWTYEYDENGNQINETRPDGTTIARTYDELDRVLTENHSSTPIEQNTYTYDTAPNGIGLPSQIVSEGSSVEYEYDLLGRAITEKTTIDGTLYEIKTTYDLLGNPLTIQTPNQKVTAYTYRDSGTLKAVVYDGNFVAENIEYSPTLAAKKIEYANGVITENEYDQTQNYLLTRKHTALGNNAYQDLEYQYDKAGNIQQILDASDTNTAKTTRYEYDDLYRLTKTTVSNAINGQNYTREYEYDIIGNFLRKSDQPGTYLYDGSHPHAVTSAGGKAFQYDLNGNMTRNGPWGHSWNWQNRIDQSAEISAKTGNIVRYSYDHSGTRTLKNDVKNTKKTAYVNKYFDRKTDFREFALRPIENLRKINLRSSQESTITETPPSITLPNLNKKILTGTTITEDRVYIYAGRQKLATHSSKDGLIFHHEDHLTGTSVDTDEDGMINQIIDYYPYGDERINESHGKFVNDYSFTGKERDIQTGLLYYDARYYESSLGRFISIDEWDGDLKDPQTLNKYSYTINNPIKYIDPDGNKVELVTRALDYKSMPSKNIFQRIDKFGAIFGNHSFLRITPDNPDDFGGRNFFTLGAGRDGNVLKKGYNHPNDFDPITPIRSGGINTISTPKGITDSKFIQNIEERFNSYKDNYVYDALNGLLRGGRNSNAFVTELINSAGGSVNSFNPNGLDIGLGGKGLKGGKIINNDSQSKAVHTSNSKNKKDKNNSNNN